MKLINLPPRPKILLKKLFDVWSYWKTNDDDYLLEKFQNFIKNPSNGTEEQNKLLQEIEEMINLEELHFLKNHFKEIFYDLKNLSRLEDKNEWEKLKAQEEQEANIKALNEKEKERLRIEKEKMEQNLKLEENRKYLFEKKRFIDLVRNILNDQFSEKVNIFPPQPTLEDMKLIEHWRKNKNLKDEKEDQRLLSARLAEKAVAIFFQNQKFLVDDISITQNNNPQGGDWERYDLKIKDELFDIKNARRYEKNYERYINLCVPNFKISRKLDVQIAGVLSYWDSMLEMQIGSKNPVLFLGTTNKEKHNKLQVEFSDKLLTVNFQESFYDSKKYLPLWMFDYPEYMYKNRNYYLNKLKKIPFPELEICKNENINPIPVYIAARIKHNYNLSVPLKEFELTLRSKISNMGLFLPVVFLSILHHFLSVLSSNSNQNYDPDDYFQVIYPDKYDFTKPLFIYDQLKTISELIKCLSVLWKERTDGLKDFKYFELRGFHILRGSINKDKWITLLAYCGECGHSPLIFGKNESCSKCGHLICNNCGYHGYYKDNINHICPLQKDT